MPLTRQDVTNDFPVKANIISGIVASGTDTYTGTYSPTPSYTAGLVVSVLFTNGNTGAATLNLNGLGAKSIVKGVSTALVSGDIPAGTTLTLSYDGTNFVIIGSNFVNQKTNYSPSFTGLVTPPTPNFAYYIDQDKFFVLRVGIPTGTGSGTTRSMTLPFIVTETQIFSMQVFANGVFVAGSARVIGGTNVLDFYQGIVGTAFVNGQNFNVTVSLTITK